MKWFHTHDGPKIQVERLQITRTGTPYYSLGWWTRIICRCEECGDTFEVKPQPGKLKLDEDGNLVPDQSI